MGLRCCKEENCAGCDSTKEGAKARRGLGEVHFINPFVWTLFSEPGLPFGAWPEFERLENQLRIAIYCTRF